MLSKLKFNFRAPGTLTVLGGLLAILLVGMVVLFGYANYLSKSASQYLSYVAEQKLLSQRITTSALEAAGGKEEAFAALERFRDRYQATLDLVKNGNPSTGLRPYADGDGKELEKLEAVWLEYKSNADSIIEKRQTVRTIADNIQSVSRTLVPLEKLSEDVAARLSEANTDSQTLYVASRQSLFIQRTQNNLSRILSGAEDASTAADQFAHDFNFFATVIEGLIHGSRDLGIQKTSSPAIQKLLLDAQNVYDKAQPSVISILDGSAQLFEVKDAAATIQIISPEILDAGTQLEAVVSRMNAQSSSFIKAGVITLLAALVVLGLSLRRLVNDARSRAKESVAVNQRNQEAILRLLDEMTALADGDLTAHATVTEDITGAIADSVNFSIDALRSLVEAINNTVSRVSQSSQRTSGIANRLANSSTQQAVEIANTTDAISKMAKTMEQVSKNAMTSADVALKSVQIAHKGAQTVRRNIEGMDAIRDTIQETSKRIKRLGESSQQIGEIVSLITDIADRTNILALNAAIQASSAGEAGRGFAVVADEVQRLAERAGNATKQIAALVETIQTDTNEAVSSMEQTTTGVVTGAKLAEDAGNALSEIETVSKQLADLIQGISREAREQASAAINISESMNVIKRITLETAEGTKETAKSIGNLNELANALKTSVAGFKLPDTEDMRTQTAANE
ncbi:MAG TPA: methyl-accepting chemotaxis protein [Gammaproteobacteria bacterium]|nr:methyl-accepting chemotaxis protein [Gammaproteobacteria bacterium]